MKKGAHPDDGSVCRDLIIVNKHGMHARPAALLIKTANQFDSDITIEKDGTAVSGRSIMGLLTLELYHGSTMRVRAVGSDAAAAVDAIEALVNRKFDEE